jgi:pimeloyl-ACP methyl ester carboxylesterase
MIEFQIPHKKNYFNAYGINHELNQPGIYFSHANGFNGLTYKTLLNKISPNQKIISYDLRGHGKSTVPAEPEKLKSWQRYRDDLISILEKNNEPSTLIGHSLGGTTSLLVAFKRPELVSKIILIDPVLLPFTYWLGTKAVQSIGLIEKVHPMVKGALVRKKTWKSKEEAFQYFSGKKLFRKVIPEAINDYIDGGIKKIDENLYELNCNPKWEAATFKLTSGGNWFNLKKSNIPTKIILTPNSVVCNERSQKKLNKSIAKIEFVTLENTTHMLPLEDIDAVGNEILSFL